MDILFPNISTFLQTAQRTPCIILRSIQTSRIYIDATNRRTFLLSVDRQNPALVALPELP